MSENGILYSDYAKLYYGRMLWKCPETRARLVRHWTHPGHPHAGRFTKWRQEVEQLLASPKGDDEQLDGQLRRRGLSLRVVVREIPSVFGDTY